MNPSLPHSVFRLADSLLSPFGLGTEVQLAALAAGRSALACHEGGAGLPPLWCAATLPPDLLPALAAQAGAEALTPFEQMAVVTAREALLHTSVDPASPRVRFVLATTKGNIGLLDGPSPDEAKALDLYGAAQRIAAHFGNPNPPLVVSQACISGMLALSVAKDYLNAGRFDYAVVIGADTLSRFALSGFHCLKALSPEPCQPFDAARRGLNLGEAAACMVLAAARPEANTGANTVALVAGGSNNDAHHISAPSRTAEGLFRLIEKYRPACPGPLDFVNTHGTATLFNDQMEGLALERAELTELPLMSFKGVFGHTLGASGLLDSVLCARQLLGGVLYPSAGFETLGVSSPVHVQRELERRPLRRCLKTASGFGGCNAVLFMELMDVEA